MNNEDKITELEQKGFCVLEQAISPSLIKDTANAFWPILTSYLATNNPNRGPFRHFMAMPFQPPIFSPAYLFNPAVLEIVRHALGETAVADQWGCDVPVLGTEYQNLHADYQRPLFPELPDLIFPPYILMVSFGLNRIDHEDGPIEIAAGTHRMAREQAHQAVSEGQISLQPITLQVGDVLIRHPWALHRGTPNLTGTPRPLLTIRYVRPWYEDRSRDVATIPTSVWQAFTDDQRRMARFPVSGYQSL